MRSKLKAVILLLLGVAVVLGGFIAQRAVFNSSLGVQVGVGVVVAVIFIAAVVFSTVTALSARRRARRFTDHVGEPTAGGFAQKEGEATGTFFPLSVNELRVGMLLLVSVVIVLGVVIAVVR